MRYSIFYNHVAGPSSRENLSWTELLQVLEDLDNNSYVDKASITIITIEP